VHRPQSNLHFKLTALAYKFRDALVPRERILAEASIKPGMCVLDYGCGPGSYIIPVATLVGESGKLYALDMHPLAIESVRRIAARRRLTNVHALLSDCDTGLPDEEVDRALLYDVLHDLSNPEEVLRELRRVLRPDGVLSFSDHHLKHEEILPGVTSGGLFKLLRQEERTYAFSPEKA
jgi:ubiquinone/menaquinone biosynthesis C-methylase UbiE